MAEVLPTAQATTAYDVTETSLETQEGVSNAIVESGTVQAIEGRALIYRQLAGIIGSNIASIAIEKSRGRATMTVTYTKSSVGFSGMFADDDGVQELIGLDVIRDIKAAKYFKTLTNAQVSEVQKAWDERAGAATSWSTLQKTLYGHMAHGQESYCETAYEFRQSFQTTSNREVRRAASDANTVKSLPSLSAAMQRLIDSLPEEGEWLKKPTTVQYAGRRGWTVCMSYQWAPQWSVIYGGTFTGLDAE